MLRDVDISDGGEIECAEEDDSRRPGLVGVEDEKSELLNKDVWALPVVGETEPSSMMG